MGKLGHKNLFDYGDRGEVYAALQRDFNRDTWVHYFWQAVFIAMAVGSVLVSNHADWLWLFGAIYAVERTISRFVDNSNRNWAMHIIDWLEHGRDGGAV